MRNHEHLHQVAVVQWATMHTKRWPELRWLFAIPNGGARHKAVAAKLKAEGVKAGVSDLMLPTPRCDYLGLFIEMKTPKGKATDTQKDFITDMRAQGYAAVVCQGSEAAIAVLKAYMGGNAAAIKEAMQ